MYPNTRKNKASMKAQAKNLEKPDLLSIHDSRDYEIVHENQTHNPKIDDIYTGIVSTKKH